MLNVAQFLSFILFFEQWAVNTVLNNSVTNMELMQSCLVFYCSKHNQSLENIYYNVMKVVLIYCHNA